MSLVNIASVGIRPQFESESCSRCTACLSVCPSYSLDAELETGPNVEMTEADHEFGHALEIWEGYATDPQIRHEASSGGILSALSLYCLEQENMSTVLHTGVDEATPLVNKTQLSTSRGEVLSRAGSRYSPSSPCDGLKDLIKRDRPSVFVGKPCDAAAVAMLRRKDPELDKKLGLVLTFFCAGTPAVQGTLDLAKSMNIEPDDIGSVRYRGQGWPGLFRVVNKNGTRAESKSYLDSWSRLTSYRSLRCNLCPDGLGRIADISCGDAWHSSHDGKDPGRSLVLVRTERGRNILHRAIAAKYVTLMPASPSAVLSAQSSLLQRRRELYGRLFGLRLLLMPTPQFTNFSLKKSWLQLPLVRRMQTISGTFRRALVRAWWRRKTLFQTSV